MQKLYLKRGSSKRLISVFLGWAMDYRPFARLHRPGYDLVLLWDYTDSHFDFSEWDDYDEIVVFGWSMGVYFCAEFPPEIERKVTRRIAVNGTMTPMHDYCGIPVDIFMGTLAGLSERNLEKFYMRVCGSREAYNAFKAHRPERDINQLRRELEGMTKLEPREGRFDLALIGNADAIFPPQNQESGWLGTPKCVFHGPHMPDFQSLIDRYVVDKEMVKQRFCDGASTYESEAVVQREMVEEMVGLLGTRRFGRILEVGCGTGLLSRKLKDYATEHFEMWDICPVTPYEGAQVLVTDAENAIKDVAPESFDLIASASAIQWFNSPINFMANAAKALRPDGLLVIGTYLEGNLEEITSLMSHSLPLMSELEWVSAIPRQYDIEEIKSWSRVVEFDTPIEAFRHLKLTGVNSLGRTSGQEVPLRNIIGRYTPAPSGKWQLTYCPVIMILKKVR